MSESIECPFCGSTDISDGELLMQKTDGTRVSQSRCNGCGALGPEALTDGPDFGSVRAIAAWNRRTPQPVTPAGGEVGARPAWWLCEVPKGQEDLFNDDEHSVFVPTEHQAQWQAEDGYTVTPLYTHPPVADAALVRDAQRYRWLRDPPLMARLPAWIAGQGNEFIESDWLTGEQADAAIDAALNQRGGGDHG